MSYFNLNNFSLLSKLGRLKETVGILLDKNELFVISSGIVKDTKGNDITEIFSKILSAPSDIVSVSKDHIQSASPDSGKEDNISFLLAQHMAGMELASFGHLVLDTLSFKMNSKLSFNEYAHYLQHTDVFVSPILYQWIGVRFDRNNDEVIPYMDVDGSLRHLASGDPRLLLQTLFILASMGSMDITSTTTSSVSTLPESPTPTPAAPDRPVVRTPEPVPVEQPKPITVKPPEPVTAPQNISPRSYTPILTKLGLGAFISGALDSHAGVISVNSDDGVYNLDMGEIAQSAANVQNLKLNNFLLKLLLANKYLKTDATGTATPDTTSLVRFKLFEQTKKLPLQLFDTNFLQNTGCMFSLAEPNYMIKAALYRSAGMDIIDFSILSMLRIRESALDNLANRLSNHTAPELSRSLFGLLILGLVKATEKDSAAKSPVPQEQKGIDPKLEQHKDMLNRIAKKLVSL